MITALADGRSRGLRLLPYQKQVDSTFDYFFASVFKSINWHGVIQYLKDSFEKAAFADVVPTSREPGTIKGVAQRRSSSNLNSSVLPVTSNDPNISIQIP